MSTPGGTDLISNPQVSNPGGLQQLVVAFDQPMYTNLTNTGASVTNPANYELLLNGVQVNGAVISVQYGMSEAANLAQMASANPSAYGQYADLDSVPTNHWEAVITVSGSAGGAKVTPLSAGQYTLVVKNTVEDSYGNVLGRTGFTPGGASEAFPFDLTVPTGSETLVFTDGGAGKYTTTDGGQATASAGNGNYVVAWNDTTSGHTGVWVKMYQQTESVTNGTRSTSTAELQVTNPATGQPWPNNEIQVTNDPTATDVAVACTPDGDFVVTWSGQTAATGWEVYARMYNAAGTPLSGVFLVSAAGATSQSVQRNSAVALDAEGDFVVTWQSLNQNTGAYGVYAQAYNSSGQPLGGTDAVEDITFINGFTGSFELSWYTGDNASNPTQTSGPIPYNGNAKASASAVATALAAMGADVHVTATSLGTLEIDFVGSSGSMPQAQMWVAPGNLVPTPAAIRMPGSTITTAVAGKSGTSWRTTPPIRIACCPTWRWTPPATSSSPGRLRH